MLPKISTFLAVVLRLYLLQNFFDSASWVAFLFGASELSVLIFTVRGQFYERCANAPLMLIVPWLYCSPLLLDPNTAHGAAFWGSMVAFAAFLQFFLRCWMGASITCGSPMFRKLIDSGPWGLIRHPMAFVEVVSLVSFASYFPSTWNLCAAIVATTLVISAALLEESFLRSFAEYRSYAARVRWRFLPGVI